MDNRSKPKKVVPDVKYQDMYRLEWKDGVLSEDMYNLSRANDILRNYDAYVHNMNKTALVRSRSLTGAFK